MVSGKSHGSDLICARASFPQGPGPSSMLEDLASLHGVLEPGKVVPLG